MSAGRRTSHPDHGPYFTLCGYRAIVERALAEGYQVLPFRDFARAGSAPVMILRHDLDHSLHGLERVVELEAELGVRATYFVQTACEFYNLLSRSGRGLLTRMTALGHEVGLHYESHRYVGQAGEKALRDDVRLLEDLSGQAVVSAAQHLPSDQDPVDVLGVLENEAYEPRFTEPPMHYISDSLMRWRQATPHELLDRGVSFQFLSHPETWLEGRADIFEALTLMGERDALVVRERYEALCAYYLELLQNRDGRDRAFRDKRGR